MISSGIPGLDALIGGGLEGVTVIYGGVGSGKSILARHVATDAHSKKVPVLVVDSESPQLWGALKPIRTASAPDAFEKCLGFLKKDSGLVVIDNVGLLQVPQHGLASIAKFWQVAITRLYQECLHTRSQILLTFTSNRNASRSGYTIPRGVGYTATNIIWCDVTKDFRDVHVVVEKSRGGVGGKLEFTIEPTRKLVPVKRHSVWERLQGDDLC